MLEANHSWTHAKPTHQDIWGTLIEHRMTNCEGNHDEQTTFSNQCMTVKHMPLHSFM